MSRKTLPSPHAEMSPSSVSEWMYPSSYSASTEVSNGMVVHPHVLLLSGQLSVHDAVIVTVEMSPGAAEPVV